QRDSEDHAAVGAEVMLQTVDDLVHVAAGAEQAPGIEYRGCGRQHGHVDQPGDPHRDHDVHALEVKDLAPGLWVRTYDPLLGQRRVEIDDVWHHGGPEDARGQQDGRETVDVR